MNSDERLLWQAYRANPNQAGPKRDALVGYYSPWVRKLASEFRKKLPKSVDPQDLLQAGCLGVLKAISKYNETKAPFGCFAVWYVRGEMARFLQKCDCIPRRLRTRAKKGEVHDTREFHYGWKSSHFRDEGDRGETDVDNADEVQYLFTLLTPRQREIMSMWFIEGMRQVDIAAKLGCTQASINHVIGRAMKRLRRNCVQAA